LELQNFERELASKQAIKQEKTQPPPQKKCFRIDLISLTTNQTNTTEPTTSNLGFFIGQRRSVCNECIAPAERREKLVVEMMMIWEIG